MPDLRDAQLMQTATSCFRAADLGGAEEALLQILAHDKKNADAFALLGQVHQKRNLYAEAERCFRQCATLRPRSSMAHVLLGESLARQSRDREAMARFEKALKLEPGMPRALVGKADVFIIRGQYRKVRTLLEPAVRAGAGGAELATPLAEALLHLGEVDEAIRVGASWLDDDATPAGIRYRLGAVVGKAHERRGAYDEAFAAWSAGNAAHTDTFDPDRYAALTDEIIDAFSAAALPALPRSAVDDARPVFVVGMPRSGSTLVERIIDAHPRAHGAGELALLYELVGALPLSIGSTRPYPACVADLGPDDVDRLGGELAAAFAALAPKADRVVDKNLGGYLHLGLITLLLPRATIIHCRRDPLDIGLSCFAEGLHPAVHPWAVRLEHIGFVHREYERLMRHWTAVLDVPVLDVAYEELCADPEPVTRRIIDHCGLTWDDRCLAHHRTEGRTQTLSHAQVRQPIYRSSIRRADRFERHLAPLRDALRDPARPTS